MSGYKCLLPAWFVEPTNTWLNDIISLYFKRLHIWFWKIKLFNVSARHDYCRCLEVYYNNASARTSATRRMLAPLDTAFYVLGVGEFNTVQGRYNAVNFLQILPNRHPIARPWDMGCLLWIKIWFMYCLSNWSTVCNSMLYRTAL